MNHVSKALEGINFPGPGLTPQDTPVDAFVMTKYLNAEGDVEWRVDISGGIHDFELLGALTAELSWNEMRIIEMRYRDEDLDGDGDL